MEQSTLLILAILVLFNIAIIKIKIDKNRKADAILDAALLFVLAFVLKGSKDMLAIGITASALISVYLWYSPIKFNKKRG